MKAGDRVLFGKYAGTEIKIDGEDFLIMREEEVLGILRAPASRTRRRRSNVAQRRSLALRLLATERG